jgi:hypothetical protein
LTGEQKIVTVLINRLVSKVRSFFDRSVSLWTIIDLQLPASTGSSLGATEADPIVQQTIAALETISETKLGLVAHGLTSVLEGFVPVSWVFDFSVENPESVCLANRQFGSRQSANTRFTEPVHHHQGVTTLHYRILETSSWTESSHSRTRIPPGIAGLPANMG